MKINEQDLYRIAHLSRLHFDEKDAHSMQKSLEDILSWMEKLNEVDTQNVVPLTHMTEEINVKRPDIAKNSIDKEEGLKNAPEQEENYFHVPRVIE